MPGKQFPADSLIFFPRQSDADAFHWLQPLEEGGQIHAVVTNVPHELLMDLIHNASRPSGGFSVNMPGETHWHLVPVTLLYTAKAYLLLPIEGNAAQTFHQYFDDLQNLMLHCLFSDLLQRYGADRLSAFASEQDLLEDYTATIAKWLCSETHHIDGLSTGGLKPTPEDGTIQFDLAFASNDSTYIKAFYQLTPHGYPVSGATGRTPEANGFGILRKRLLQQQLEGFFEFIKNQWVQLRALGNPNAYVLNILREVIAKATQGMAHLEVPRGTPAPTHEEFADGCRFKVEHLEVPRGIPAPTPEGYDYAFFITKGGQWQVYFQKENHSRRTSSPQGMYAIMHLLANPNKHIHHEDLHNFLKNTGTQYGVESHENSSDPGLDAVNLEDNEERFEDYKAQWNRIRHKDDERCSLDDLYILATFLGIIDTQIEHVSVDKKVMFFHLRAEVVAKEKKLKLYLDVDENFSQTLKDLKKKTPKTGNAKNRLETIRKGIRRAQNDFKESAPALYKYLKETIVVTKTKTPDAEYGPFIYAPSLAENPDLHYIGWVTSPPSE